MANTDEHEALIAQFTSITGAPSRQAVQFLSASGGDLEAAMGNYYAAQDDHTEDHADDSDYIDEDEPISTHQPQSGGGGGRRLGEGPSDPHTGTELPAADSSQSQSKGTSQKKFATLGDFSTAHGNSDDSDDDEKQDLFAGGEKSALAVQNPDDLKKRILEKAQRRGPPPKESSSKKSFFTGSARTLGGDEVPSREIPVAPRPRQFAERVERTLHFWQDGFSIDDGDLYRNDDSRNAEVLNLIRQGRAPLSIMNVQAGQEVDVEIKQHDEKYVKPKIKYKPFGGSGNRLGSPTPGLSSMPGAFSTQPEVPAPSTTTGPSSAAIDDSQPTVTLRISLGSGTRFTSRFNMTQTVQDVYDFVRQAETGGREFILQTTFPTTELVEMGKVLGEMPEFKRGGAVVQKYL